MLLRAGSLEFPLSQTKLFGREGRLVLEVGHGDGRFTAEIARRNPDWNILGVEVSAGSVARALKRMRREGIRTVRLYHGEARFALRNFIAPRSLYRVYVNFPDPWPKAKHEENRLLKTEFFRRLSTRLIDGGQLLLTTDHEEYWRFAQEQAQASGLFDVKTPPPPPHHLETKYALKWKEQNRSFYHAVFTKTGEDPEPWPVIERFSMAHALLSGELPQVKSFEKQIVPFAGGHAIVLQAYRALEDHSLVFLAHLEEEDLTQQVLIEARPSAHGIYVGISSFGAPLVTAGVKAAVAWVTDWLEAQGLKVVQRSY
ncbi:MAG: tRNA (guanosine(46)-N7)-methyltransferase TrmB [Deinococcota bacterium]|uniref:tRNA (guanosine(46)-N7)-methyltransferase TrmB n=1 Tax=Allomeiothermus silvanus TaxID=52022 RepID=UPI0023F1961E|nr:tRNA (guanosine(46)-N7)-methyltransferase TrmB [Allomeiothermus silvanus]